MAAKRAETVKPANREKRSSRRQEPPRKSAKSSNALVRYFQDTREELRKVTWPSQEEITRLTMIVLGATFAFAVFLGLLDFIFQRLAGLLI